MALTSKILNVNDSCWPVAPFLSETPHLNWCAPVFTVSAVSYTSLQRAALVCGPYDLLKSTEDVSLSPHTSPEWHRPTTHILNWMASSFQFSTLALSALFSYLWVCKYNHFNHWLDCNIAVKTNLKVNNNLDLPHYLCAPVCLVMFKDVTINMVYSQRDDEYPQQMLANSDIGQLMYKSDILTWSWHQRKAHGVSKMEGIIHREQECV